MRAKRRQQAATKQQLFRASLEDSLCKFQDFGTKIGVGNQGRGEGAGGGSRKVIVMYIVPCVLLENNPKIKLDKPQTLMLVCPIADKSIGQHPKGEQTMIAQTWDYMPLAPREAVCRMAGWRTAKGNISQTGRRISRQSWDTMTPAARVVLEKYYDGKGGLRLC